MKLSPITVDHVAGPLFLSAEARAHQIFLAREDAERLARDLQHETGEAFKIVSHDYMNQSGYRTYTVARAGVSQ